MKNINIASVHENEFKESSSVTIASNIIEKDRKFKTYFNQLDKRGNVDGSMMLLNEGYPVMTIDVQIKTLPSSYDCKKSDYQYFYDCDTKIFNVVRLNHTLNPVMLIMVDIPKKKVFSILLTRNYVADLKITSEKTKRIFFNDEDIFDADMISKKLYEYNKILESDHNMEVLVGNIRSELERTEKLRIAGLVDLENYQHIYSRGTIRGYLCNYIYDSPSNIPVCQLYFIDLETGKFDIMQVNINESEHFVYLYRPTARSSTTNADIVNILYEFSHILKKEVLFFYEGEPFYYINNKSNFGDIWRLRAEKIEKEW